MILTELSPFTPESASMTLSRIFCEKFQFTPRISRSNSRFISSISSCLVRGRILLNQPRMPLCGLTSGHSPRGLSGTKNSEL